MKNKVLAVLFYSVCLLSCLDQNYKKRDIHSLVNEWNKKEIKFPENIYFTKYITDTIHYDFIQTDYKILFYMDSIGCLECKLKLHRWKHLIADFDSTLNTSISYIFLLDTKHIEKIKDILHENEFDYPVCVDMNGEFQKINYFPEDNRFHVFLLNKENRIVAIGNPTKNETIKEIYKRTIKMYH